MADKLTSQESAYAKCWLEAGCFSSLHVLKAQLDVQGVRENNRLLLFYTKPVIELPHHLHKPSRVPRVLTHPGERVRISLCGSVSSSVLNGCTKWRCCLAQACHRRCGRCRRGRWKSCSMPFCGNGKRWDLSLEGLQERWGSECISKGNAKDLGIL